MAAQPFATAPLKVDVTARGQEVTVQGRIDVHTVADVRLALHACIADGSGDLYLHPAPRRSAMPPASGCSSRRTIAPDAAVVGSSSGRSPLAPIGSCTRPGFTASSTAGSRSPPWRLSLPEPRHQPTAVNRPTERRPARSPRWRRPDKR